MFLRVWYVRFGVFLWLVTGVLLGDSFVFSRYVRVVASTPGVSVPVFVFRIYVTIGGRRTAFALWVSRRLECTGVQ